jgi:hypothetical protein
MSKIVRARPKKVEHLDSVFHCCEQFLDSQRNEPETIFDLDRKEVARMTCGFCGADHGILHGAMDTRVNKMDALELYDLDEGEAVSA